MRQLIVGFLFIVGGLSGQLVFIGTNSSGLLIGVGVVLLFWGAFEMVMSGRSPQRQKIQIAQQPGRKTRTADEKAKVYQAADSKSPVLAELKEGDEIVPLTYAEVDGVDWLKVKLPDEREGFFLGNTYATVKAVIKDKEAPIFRYNHGSDRFTSVVGGTEMEIESFVIEDPNIPLPPYRRVCLADGQHGFMGTNVRFKLV